MPFRALDYHYDGKPVGPELWSGPVGKSIKNRLASVSIVAFYAGKSDDFPSISKDIIDNLSWDQKYLCRICLFI